MLAFSYLLPLLIVRQVSTQQPLLISRDANNFISSTFAVSTDLFQNSASTSFPATVFSVTYASGFVTTSKPFISFSLQQFTNQPDSSQNIPLVSFGIQNITASSTAFSFIRYSLRPYYISSLKYNYLAISSNKYHSSSLGSCIATQTVNKNLSTMLSPFAFDASCIPDGFDTGGGINSFISILGFEGKQLNINTAIIDIQLDYSQFSGNIASFILYSQKNSTYVNQVIFQWVFYNSYFFTNPSALTAFQTQSFDNFQRLSVPTSIITCIPDQFLQSIYAFYLDNGSNIKIYFTNSTQNNSCILIFHDQRSTSQGRYSFQYFQIISKICPPTYPSFKAADQLCYAVCPEKTYADSSGNCQPCRYDCTTCNPSTVCLSCASSSSFRTLNGSRCVPMSAFY